MSLIVISCMSFISVHVAKPPRIISHLKNAIRGKFVKVAIRAIGTKPLSYQWQWKPTREGWQPCTAEWSNGATLTIPKVQKSNEGSYRCVVSNCAGIQTSNPAKLLSVGKVKPPITMNCLSLSLCSISIHLAEQPRITSQPEEQLCVGKNTILTLYKRHHLVLCICTCRSSTQSHPSSTRF